MLSYEDHNFAEFDPLFIKYMKGKSLSVATYLTHDEHWMPILRLPPAVEGLSREEQRIIRDKCVEALGKQVAVVPETKSKCYY